MKRVILAVAAIGLLGGCGIFEGDGKPKTPTIGFTGIVRFSGEDRKVSA